jgi:outer membrane biosynthesis protein TonB
VEQKEEQKKEEQKEEQKKEEQKEDVEQKEEQKKEEQKKEEQKKEDVEQKEDVEEEQEHSKDEVELTVKREVEVVAADQEGKEESAMQKWHGLQRREQAFHCRKASGSPLELEHMGSPRWSGSVSVECSPNNEHNDPHHPIALNCLHLRFRHPLD